MKHTGSCCDFSEARNRDLLRAYHHVLRSAPCIRLSDVFRRVVRMPSARFWVSTGRALDVCNMIARKGFAALARMNHTRRAMYIEIYRRTEAHLARHPNASLSDAVCAVLRGPAPCFYLTPASAKTILNRYRGKCRNERS